MPHMDEGSDVNQSMIRRLQELECERNQLKNDLEQLCLQQAGPSFLGVVTRIHLQRTADLEQEIESLKKKTTSLTRENKNLHEELSEAYRIKGQLADLYNAEASKNNEMGKQVKFFQGCIASAFAERDHALMESETAKEREEAILLELSISRDRVEEIESTCADLWKENASLQIELLNIKEKILPFEKVISKFSDIRQRDTDYVCDGWDDKCTCLLNDPIERWSFDEDRNSSTMAYIASLEEKLAAMKLSVENLQSEFRMGLEIEQHLNKKAQVLEKKIVGSYDFARAGLLRLRSFLVQIRSEVITLLQEGSVNITSIVSEIQDKMITEREGQGVKICIMKNDVSQRKEIEQEDQNISHGDGSVITDANVGKINAISPENLETFDALSLALQEKVDALILLSQQEERQLLERDLNSALLLKIGELQSNLHQVADEKVKILLELAEVKQKVQQQKQYCKCEMKYGLGLADRHSKELSSQLREGKLKDIFRKTYLGRWMGKGVSGNEVAICSSNETCLDPEKPLSDTRTLEEATVLPESVVSLKKFASSVHTLHLSLSKARDNVSGLTGTAILDLLDGILVTADQIKVALSSSLPVSSSIDPGENCIITDDRSSQSVEIVAEKPDILSTFVFEMAELLVLLAGLLKEKATSATTSTEVEPDHESKSEETGWQPIWSAPLAHCSSKVSDCAPSM